MGKLAAFLVLAALCTAVSVHAQVTASIEGTVRDASGGVIPGATITVKHVETGLTRSAQTDAAGNYSVPSIPIGEYEVIAESAGFKKETRAGINLVVGQTAVVNLTLEVGTVEQNVTVTGEAPLVNTTTSQTEGLVSEQQVKDLPLNGRSFDQLLTLTTNSNNYTSNDSRNAFSLSGKRVETNRFLINGIDYVGEDSTGQFNLPYGASGDLLGVDAVREFNVEADSYGAEYGKRAGGQISIVTSSGTNQLHGDLFEFLRNTDTDASSFFSSNVPGVAPTVLKRNQFGGALGGPIEKDKLFFFTSYEGVRQTSSTGTISYIPDEEARNGFLPNSSGVYTQVAGLNPGMLPLVQIAWPDPATFPGGCQEQFIKGEPTGVCAIVTAPAKQAREDFAITRMDYNISSVDLWSTTYLYDNGIDRSAGTTVPIAGSESPLSSQLLSIQETHIFSPSLLNVATLGFSRAYANTTPAPYMLYNGPAPAIPAIAYFVTGANEAPGAITVGGGTSGSAGANSTISGGLGSSSGPLTNTRNLFTWADDVHYTKGNHTISMGAWVQRVQANSSAAPANTAGGATFSSITTLLQGTVGTFLVNPQANPMGYRSTEYAYYWQDDIKLKHNLDVRAGLRMEGDSGWNEHTGRASNYFFTNGVLNTLPNIGDSPFAVNNSKALWQPRVGIAWDPTGKGVWSVRAGFGIFNDLLDNLNHHLMVNPPYNLRETYTNVPFLSYVPISSSAPTPPTCTAAIAVATPTCAIPELGGADPDIYTPTTEQWNFAIERQLAKDLMLHIGYVGLESYHTMLLVDTNQPVPQICNNPAGCASGGVNTSAIGTGRVPDGTYYLPLQVNPATGLPDGCRPNCDLLDTQTWWTEGTSSYNALDVFLQKRFSHGMTFRVNYTWSKVLDLNSAGQGSEGSNEPDDLYDFYDMQLNKGPAAFNVGQQFNFNFTTELPFGRGRAFAGNANRIVDGVIGGWQVNGIFTAQSGFPFTPEVGSSNITGEGDTHSIDLPNVNPAFNGQLYNTSSVTNYFNTAAFVLPLPGTFGNAGRGQYTGPGLMNLDMSMFKNFPVGEHRTLEFRAEAFNLTNTPNFGSPNPTIFTATGTVSPTAGSITKLNGTNRELQFGLKFIF